MVLLGTDRSISSLQVAGDEDTCIAKCIKIKAPSRSIDVSVSWLAPMEGKIQIEY